MSLLVRSANCSHDLSVRIITIIMDVFLNARQVSRLMKTMDFFPRVAMLASLLMLLGLLSSCSNDQQISEVEPVVAVVEMTLGDVVSALENEEVSSTDLVRAYLARIDAMDRQGPALQALIAINPDAMTLAAASDARRAAGNPKSRLDGVPVLLKDNIESMDAMATTAGSTALLGNVTGRDSPLVASLRASGAIILGKTNLSQWANYRSTNSVSGWSSVGGLVKNPHVLDRQACGSSSGSASATAASFAAASVGTETNGSIICPSQVNGVVGLKPTHGLLSTDHIVPIAATQDTAGPITKSVAGAALLLDGMTDWQYGFFDGLDVTAIAGMRIGVMNFSLNGNPRLTAAFKEAVAALEGLGAELVAIDEFERDDGYWASSGIVMDAEFKAYITDYLAGSPADIPVRSLSELVEFNQEHAAVEQAIFDQDIFVSAQDAPALDSEAYQIALATVKVATREKGIDFLLSRYQVDVLVGPSGPVSPRVDVVNGDVWPAWAGAGSLAAVSGYPNLTVPMGDVAGVPVGISFMSGSGKDQLLLSVGLAFELATNARLTPAYKPSVLVDDMAFLE